VAHILQAAQAEAPEASSLLDLSEDWLDDRFAHFVNGSPGTVSVGVATALSRQGGTMRMPESLLLAADNALYKAKREGRNRVATALLVAFKEP